MDTRTLIIASALIIVCFSPFILLAIGRKIKEKKLLLPIQTMAKNNNCLLTKFDIWDYSAIGLDETCKKLFFYRNIKNTVKSREVKLSEIEKCRIINSGRPVNKKESYIHNISKLELEFVPFVKEQTPFFLEFFNSEVNMQLVDELQLIEKWLKIINDIVKKN